MVVVNISVKEGEKPISYYLEPRLKVKLESKVINALKKKDKDFVMAIDGGEGAGKSTFAFQIGKFVDPTLNLSRVTFNPEQFRQAIYDAKKHQCVIYDEAFTGLSSRSSLSAVNRILVSLMMQMRQKNLFVIIVLPSFFLLDKYVALFRTQILIHVYESRGIRGYFRVYNRTKKKNLFILGKQTYSYMPKKVYTKFKGRFYGVFALGDEKVEEEYRLLKDKALKSTEKTPLSTQQVRHIQQRDAFCHLLKTKTGLSARNISKELKEYGLDISFVQIALICSQFNKETNKRDVNYTDIIEDAKDLINIDDINENINEKGNNSEFSVVEV